MTTARRAATPLSAAGFFAFSLVAYAVWQDSAAWSAVGPVSAHALGVMLLLIFLVTYVAHVTCAAQRRNPARRTGTLSVLYAATFALLWLGPSQLTPVLLILNAVILAGISARITASALIVANLIFFAILRHRWDISDPGFLVLVYGSFQAFAAVTTTARTQAEAVAAQLRQVNAGLLATRALLAESARDSERLRVSRELHDVAGHKLTALTLNLELLDQDAALTARRELAVSRQLARELLADVRSVVSSLRYDDGIDIREALRRVVEPFPSPAIHLDIPAHLRVTGAERADVLVRASQEALTNAVRHARAANIWVTLNRAGGFVELVVRDDGAYPGSHVAGHGLIGMQERVADVGGSVDATPAAEGGFRLTVRVPDGVGA